MYHFEGNYDFEAQVVKLHANHDTHTLQLMYFHNYNLFYAIPYYILMEQKILCYLLYYIYIYFVTLISEVRTPSIRPRVFGVVLVSEITKVDTHYSLTVVKTLTFVRVVNDFIVVVCEINKHSLLK